RVTAIEETDRNAGEVTFEMRGDANAVEDPEPYTATEVRRVMVALPGAARVIQWFGDPYVLGGLTLGATVLVIWAFWPRERTTEEPGDQDGCGGAPPPRETTLLHAAGAPLLAALVLTAPGAAEADTALI